MIARGHPFLRTLRLLVACVVWVFCHGHATLPQPADPMALVVTIAAAAHAPAEPAPEITQDAQAPRQNQRCGQRPAPPPPAPRAPAEPARAIRDTASPRPSQPLYALNCALLC